MTNSQLDQLLNEQVINDQEIVDVDEAVIKLVIFRLAEQHFAFAGANISEVLQGDEAVHFLPGMPASVEGVMNVRGDIESVIRLDTLLQLASKPVNANLEKSSILLASSKTMHSGLRVDQLIDVADLPESQLKSPPDAMPEHLRPFAISLFSFNDLAVTLLDLDAVFAAWLAEQG